MGWYLRRSLNFGPFRLNFSKSGIGASVGVTGARVSFGPRGNYVHMGRHGVYYRERLGSTPVRPTSEPQVRDVGGVTLVGPEVAIVTAGIDQLVDASAASVLDAINANSTKSPYWPSALLVLIPCALAIEAYPVAAAVGTASGLILALLLSLRDESRRSTPLLYELTEDAERRFEGINGAFAILSRASRLWRVVSKQENFDWKRNAGAASFIKRTRIALGYGGPKYIATNVNPWMLNVGDQRLYFFPDRLFVQRGSRFGAVAYTELTLSVAPSRFIEDEAVPAGAEVVGSSWLYVRRDGGPDLRFSNNRQLPIVLYGLLRIRSNSGMDIHVQVSDFRTAQSFLASYLAAMRIWSGGRHVGEVRTASSSESGSIDGDQRKHGLSTEIQAAYETLDLAPGSSREDVDRAFRDLAKHYHPDKVSHLAREFRDLANARMVELNAARERLHRYFESAA